MSDEQRWKELNKHYDVISRGFCRLGRLEDENGRVSVRDMIDMLEPILVHSAHSLLEEIKRQDLEIERLKKAAEAPT